ncbi:hypothetical protein ACYSNO_02350 [Enterococcus sp. LJL98]
MFSEALKEMGQLLFEQALWLRVVFLIGGLVVLLFLLYLLLSFLFFPVMYLFNRLTDKNQSNTLSREELLLGELTEKIQGASIGEVMAVDHATARSTYPAKLYREEEQKENRVLRKGSKVLIVGFDDQGVALVVERNRI